MGIPRVAALLLLCAASAAAEPVALKGGLGQGIIVSHRGHCYLLFPAHVEPVAPVFSLFTAPPQATGSAAVFLRRSEPDIGIALVRGSAAEACTTPYAALPRDVSALLSARQAATLERVNPQGGIERLSMRIDGVSWATAPGPGPSGLYQYVHASTDTAAGETREMFEGTSGAFLYVDGTPVGMTVTAPDRRSVRALRIEEILAPAEQWFATGSMAGQAAEEAPGDAAPLPGLPFEVTEWSGTPVEGTHPPDLAAGGSLRIAAGTLPFSFVLDLGPKPIPVRSLVLAGTAPGDDVGPPRFLSVDVDRSSGPARFQPASETLEMTQDGAALPVPLNTFARRIRVNVEGGWSDAAATGIASAIVQPPD